MHGTTTIPDGGRGKPVTSPFPYFSAISQLVISSSLWALSRTSSRRIRRAWPSDDTAPISCVQGIYMGHSERPVEHKATKAAQVISISWVTFRLFTHWIALKMQKIYIHILYPNLVLVLLIWQNYTFTFYIFIRFWYCWHIFLYNNIDQLTWAVIWWRLMEPGHQQSWDCHILNEIFCCSCEKG